jgi:LDH2 family malate/lactate/ureidoglycolate dehydrogenase
MAETFHLFPAARVEEQAAEVLRAWGMDEPKIATTARLMVETDLRGIESHGISMLILYEEMQKGGGLKLAAEPRIVRESAATALIDAGAGLGHPASVMAMELAIAKAKTADVGIVSVFNSHHFGAAGLYAEMAARQGLIGIVSCTSRLVTVVPTYGGERRLGTNPFAFAAPAKGNPVILDMSTSVVAANKVKTYALNGKDIPAGWVTDGAGAVLTDAEAAYELLFGGSEGGLAPVGGAGMDLGGHKGYGLAIFAQILSSTLGGGSFSPIRNLTQQRGEGDNIGQFFQAINPAAFRPEGEFERDLDAMIDVLRQTPPADPAKPVIIPGDPEWQSRERRLAEGIPLPESLLKRIAVIARGANAPFVLTS